MISRTNKRSWGFISQSNFNPLYNHLISLVWYWMVFNIRKLRTKMERKETEEEVPSKGSLCIGSDWITWYFIKSWLFVLENIFIKKTFDPWPPRSTNLSITILRRRRVKNKNYICFLFTKITPVYWIWNFQYISQFPGDQHQSFMESSKENWGLYITLW